jgi:hypothetical protein
MGLSMRERFFPLAAHGRITVAVFAVLSGCILTIVATVFDNTPNLPTFEAYAGPMRPNEALATVQFRGQGVSIRSIKMNGGPLVYDIERDKEANPIRLLPGFYEIAIQIVFDTCESCRQISMRGFEFKPGHTYTWWKAESKTYGSWYFSETDEAGKGLGLGFY